MMPFSKAWIAAEPSVNKIIDHLVLKISYATHPIIPAKKTSS